MTVGYTGKYRVFRKSAEQITKGTRLENRREKVVVSFGLYARVVLTLTQTQIHARDTHTHTHKRTHARMYTNTLSPRVNEIPEKSGV